MYIDWRGERSVGKRQALVACKHGAGVCACRGAAVVMSAGVCGGVLVLCCVWVWCGVVRRERRVRKRPARGSREAEDDDDDGEQGPKATTEEDDGRKQAPSRSKQALVGVVSAAVVV